MESAFSFSRAARGERIAVQPAKRAARIGRAHHLLNSTGCLTSAYRATRAPIIGLAWQTLETCDYEQIVWHNGAVDGESSALYFAPRRGFALVLLANAVDADLDAIAHKMLDRIAASKALEPRRPRPRKALADLAGGIVAALDDYSEAAYAGAFTSSFRKALPLDVLRPVFAKFHERHGDCVLSGTEHVVNANVATFRATCQRGRMAVEATLREEGGPRLDGLRFTSAGFAPPRPVKEAAERALALADRWDDRAAATIAPPATRVRSDLTSAHARFGRCKLETTDVSDGATRAVYPLRCEQGGAELTITVSDDGLQIRGFQIHERARTERCR